MLYKYSTINREIFKTGRYLTFGYDASSLNVDSISYYNENSEYVPRFYKVRLLHQLNNGYLDLTDRIWNKFISHRNDVINERKDITPSYDLDETKSFWFSDPDSLAFKFYCPYRYKGKLVMTTEIEEIPFNLESSDMYYDSSSNIYQLTLKIKIDETTTVGMISLIGMNIIYTINGVESESIEVTGDTYTITNISSLNKDSIIYYKITPRLAPSSGTLGQTFTEIDFPQKYIDKLMISGSKRITDKLDDITFERDIDFSTCKLNFNTRLYNKIKLVNSKGVALDLSLLPTETPFYFVHEDEYVADPSIIGTYDDNLSKPTYIFQLLGKEGIETDENIIFNTTSIINSFKNFNIELPDASCSLLDLNITLNIPIGGTYDGILTVKQAGYPDQVISTGGINTSDIHLDIYPNLTTNIYIREFGYEPINHVISPSTTDVIVNYALIADVYAVRTSPTNGYFLSWYFVWNVPTNLTLTYNSYLKSYTLAPKQMDALTLTYKPFGFKAYLSQSIAVDVLSEPFDYATLTSSYSPVTTIYNNISDNSLIADIGGYLFRKTVTKYI